jgi:hypothetical protein
MPASPDTRTICRRPVSAERQASAISARSRIRPTILPSVATSAAGASAGAGAAVRAEPIVATKR